MKQEALLILLIFFGLSSCNSTKQAEKQPNEIKLEQIKRAIHKSGFVKLPLAFDANNENSFESTYVIDLNSNDSLIFDSDMYSIVGFLPDTTGYYAILFHTVGDMLYPTILTLDKKGKKIDRQIICASGCAGHAFVDVISCYDSVWVNKDLRIMAVSKVRGTVEIDDPIPQTIDICNMRILEGSIEKTGKIIIKPSDLIDCN
jgi:hypothetical protein